MNAFLRISTPLYNVYLNEADEWSARLDAQLQQWRQDPQQRCRIRVVIGRRHDLGGKAEHRQSLLGRQHDLHELAAQQRVLRDRLAERATAARGGQRLVEAAPHHRGGAHAVAETGQVDLFHHLLERFLIGVHADGLGQVAVALRIAGHLAAQPRQHLE